MSSERDAHHRKCRNRKPFTRPGVDNGKGILGTGETASAAKKAPQENLYVSDRPNGIAEPNRYLVSTESKYLKVLDLRGKQRTVRVKILPKRSSKFPSLLTVSFCSLRVQILGELHI